MRVVVVGEAMLEHRPAAAAASAGFGGDTLNTAVHMARMGASVSFVSALGNDPVSGALVQAWQAEGIDTRHVLAHPTRQPGIYTIHNDADGERSFLYWRDRSAARDMFALAGIEAAIEAMQAADLLYCSLITFAILPGRARARLLDAIDGQRAAGGRFAFDSNYRPALWSSRKMALSWARHAMARTCFGLPTLSDEVALRGVDCSAADVARAWIGAGASEVAVKTGEAGCTVADGAPVDSANISPYPVARVLDTSGAGDAFNAGYLVARMHGHSMEAAARAGHRLAGWTIQRPGALPPRDEQAPYTLEPA